jgi:hypothetical protein
MLVKDFKEILNNKDDIINILCMYLKNQELFAEGPLGKPPAA